jgi:hypothetical protein
MLQRKEEEGYEEKEVETAAVKNVGMTIANAVDNEYSVDVSNSILILSDLVPLPPTDHNIISLYLIILLYCCTLSSQPQPNATQSITSLPPEHK